MTKHTNGPWRNSHWNSNNQILVQIDTYQTALVNPKMVIDELGGLICTDEHVNECEANARLITAAPDLLDACESALRAICVLSPDCYRGILGNLLRNAIEKATKP